MDNRALECSVSSHNKSIDFLARHQLCLEECLCNGLHDLKKVVAILGTHKFKIGLKVGVLLESSKCLINLHLELETDHRITFMHVMVGV